MAQALSAVTPSPDLGLVKQSPTRMEYRASRAGTAFAGIVLLGAIGPILFCIVNAVADFLDDPWSGGSVPRWVPLEFVTVEFGGLLLILIGGVIAFAVIGIALSFGHNRVIFDKEAGTMTLWCRSPVGELQTVHHLNGFTTIHVHNNGRRWFHNICFIGPPEPELIVATMRSRKKAEEIADQIAMFLDWQVAKEQPANLTDDEQSPTLGPPAQSSRKQGESPDARNPFNNGPARDPSP